MLRFFHMDNNLPDDQNQKPDGIQPTSTGSVSLDKERGAWGAIEQGEPSAGEYKEPAVPKEAEGWLEKLEKGEEVKLPQPVTDDTGQIVLDDATPKVKKIELPLTRDQVKVGLHHKVWDSFRWLAEWSWRMVKIGSGRFVYRKARPDVQ